MADDETAEPAGRGPLQRVKAWGAFLIVVLLLGSLSGCVTPATHRKLERQVIDLKRAGGPSAPRGTDLADLGADLQKLRRQVSELRGRVEIAEKNAADALAQSRQARREAAGSAISPVEEGGGEVAIEEKSSPEGPASAELEEYRVAYASWRSDDHGVCIDRFRAFLQTNPSSDYADDAAFWMADCHFKQGDYRNAVLRFDDVVRNYPTGNKAPDALYRQGEALLKLGPGFHEAAKRAFERVVNEYPDSARAPESQKQLDLLEKTG